MKEKVKTASFEFQVVLEDVTGQFANQCEKVPPPKKKKKNWRTGIWLFSAVPAEVVASNRCRGGWADLCTQVNNLTLLSVV